MLIITMIWKKDLHIIVIISISRDNYDMLIITMIWRTRYFYAVFVTEIIATFGLHLQTCNNGWTEWLQRFSNYNFVVIIPVFQLLIKFVIFSSALI